MPKQKTHVMNKQKDNKILITINPFEVEKKVRKPLPPATQIHRDKTQYSRKSKHPKKQEE